ncbi:MAG: nucleotidyltransferase family protein [Planctomycetia bacterium]|nr:nucleotidyltransferase family protein [Planctomycetia bacterium]
MVPFFRDVSVIHHWTPADWSELFRFARAGRLLAQVEARLRRENLLEQVPAEGRWQLTSARIRFERARRQMLWEVDCLERALRESEIPVVLLKGAAYLMADFPWSDGRISVDVDILVPQEMLSQVESWLMLSGWVAQKKSEYDDHFYRDWMHELPPMVHWDRKTELDVHHTLLPRTGKITIDSQRLWEEVVPFRGIFSLLSPHDMVLHSILHTFQDGDLSDCFRDLLDLDGMLRYFSESEPDFWTQLRQRSEAFGLHRPVYHAFRTLREMLHTPIPDTVFPQEVPGIFSRCWMDFAIRRAILPELPSRTRFSVAISRKGLGMRQHWLRMPLKLLIPHLWHKWQERRREAKKRKTT